MSETRDRLKKEALALFVKNGYAGTTIGAIEKAAGLAPRAGAFYRHFDSKEALAIAIAREDVVEREDEFNFIDLLPLNDTRAELLLIARGYLQANVRQKKYYALIQELRMLPALRKFEQSANEEMFAWVKKWVGGKNAAAGLTDEDLGAFAMTVFGGLLFYTTKNLQGINMPDLSENSMVAGWVDHWALALDARPAKSKSRKAG